MKTTIFAAALVAALALPALAEHKLNINTADEKALLKLPEMNEARAKAIVNYRKNTGDLIQLEELELIPQVKPIFPKLKDHLVLE
ncbi:MAG: ComEA family DNA-binding protein, partial [Candidatus Binatia bacterium]